MGLKTNMRVSQEAISYVNGRMSIGSSNWPGQKSADRKAGESIVKNCRTTVRLLAEQDPTQQQVIARKIGSPVSIPFLFPDTIQLYIKTAEAIASFQGGHCGEKSFVAFAYAVSQRVSVAHFMIEGGNHEFIIVGTNPVTRGNKYAVMLEKWPPVDIFGPKAVVCDPWYRGGVAYGIRDNWAPNFVNSIKNATDKNLVSRSTWDSPESLQKQWNKPNAMIKCLAYASASCGATVNLPLVVGQGSGPTDGTGCIIV